FGSESIGWNAARGEQLADAIHQGVPLDEALSRAGEAIGESAGVLLRTGRQVGDVPAALESITRGSRQFRPLWTASAARLCYLTVIVMLMLLPIIFTLVKIVPSFQKIFAEFRLPLPLLTQFVIAFSGYAMEYGFLALPAIFGLLMFAM